MQIQTMAFLCVTLAAAPAAAQVTDAQARAKTDRAPVVVVVPGGTWRGQLVDIDDRSVTIQPPGRAPVTLPLSNVLRVEARKRDPIGNGALIGAIVLLVQCLAVCGQGLDNSGDLGAVVLFNTVVGAGIGAAIDAAHTSRVTLYKRESTARRGPSPGLFVSIRF